MIEIGRLCIKIAGRDAGKKCVVIDVIDDSFVLIDGETRRKRCNKLHLEPSADLIEVTKGAEHNQIITEFKKLGIELRDTKPKKAAKRPRKVRLKNTQENKQDKNSEKVVKKEKKPELKQETKVEQKEEQKTQGQAKKTELEKKISV